MAVVAMPGMFAAGIDPSACMERAPDLCSIPGMPAAEEPNASTGPEDVLVIASVTMAMPKLRR
ncbi:hypothetical protein ABZ468_25050 [Streptomyces sp. NPDC005708]|uniref:hypothetical protein n=1 Tax=Streptomyces sp. NPDC005708 TaxID=3154564 RepID=UPI0033D7E017